MNKKLSKLIVIILIIFSACRNLEMTAEPDVGQLTSQADNTQPVSTPIPRPTLDPATEKALEIYPLYLGSTWVYQYLGYDNGIEVVWRVVETVVETRIVDGYYVAVLERTAEVLEGTPTEDFRSAPDPGTFWYLVDGKDLYRFDSFLHADLSAAWLDLVLPFPSDGRAWYPDPDMRALIEPSTTGFRYASDPFQKVLPMGGTYTCYNVATRFADGTAEGTFCETIGFVYQEHNYYERPFGYRSELTGFSLQ